MTIEKLNLGAAPNDGSGQPLRSGGQIINDNFAELDSRTTAAQQKAEQGVADAAAAKAKADAAVPGAALGVSVAQLVGGTVPASQLPSSVDSVLEFAALGDFPSTGEPSKIYIAINSGDSSANPTRQYRWNGSTYVLIPASPGSTDQVLEGATNQYFTPARVRSTLLAGLGSLANTAILAGDTILQALAKLQGQLNAKLGPSDTAADSTKLNGQSASFYTAPMTGAAPSTPGVKGLVPAPVALGPNPKFLSDDGTWKEVSVGASLPVGTLYIHMGAADKIPAGMLPLNGQLVDRATWPQLWQKYLSGDLLLASESIWQANPDYRAYASTGTTASNFRLPDLNGQQSGSIGAVFVRGWNSAMLGPARIRPDQLGPMKYVNNTYGGTTSVYIANASGTTATLSRIGAAANPQVTPVDGATDGTKWITNTGDETHPKEVAFIYCIVGATTTSNPGTVDVTALATQVAGMVLDGEFVPGLSLVTTGGVVTPVSASLFTAFGSYTKVGNRVSLELVLRLGATKPTGNTTDSLRITGLPFLSKLYSAAPATDLVYPSAFQLNNGASTSGSFTTASVPAGVSYISCQKFISGTVSNLTLADINASAVFRVSLVYMAGSSA